MAYCPNISDSQVVKDFNSIVEHFGGNPLSQKEFKDSSLRDDRTGTNMSSMELAYYLWDKYAGDINLIKLDANYLNPVKEEVNFVFKQNPELAKIGTQQQYSKYLDTIFPSSKVKGINYHGTEYRDKFEKFDSKLSGTQTKDGLQTPGFWFTYNREFAEDFGGNIISVLVNIKKPYYATMKLAGENIVRQVYPDQVMAVNKAIEEGYDSAFVDVEEGFSESGITGKTELVVFEPEQIHILSSKKDLEMFRNFINFTKSEYAKYGDIQQFKDYIISKNFAAVEEFLVVNNKIDRKC